MTDSQRTVVYTDGACSGNPGPGGWGWVVPDGEAAFGGAAETTNQRMELTAALEAVRALPGPLKIVSDSTYVVNCFRDSWWVGWLKRDWKNSQKKPVANRDIWEPLIELYQQRDVEFEWVKGHSGDRWNDRADELAVAGAEQAKRGVGASSNDSDDDEALIGDGGRGTADAADRAPNDARGERRRRVAVLGHRPPELGGYDNNPISAAVEARLAQILAAHAELHGEIEVLTGLQLGAEQLGAQAATNAGVDYVAVLAFPDPAARWPKPSQQRFDALLDKAIDVVVLSTKVPGSTAEAAKAFAGRDRWLLAEADQAIIVWDGSRSPLSTVARNAEKALGDDVWILDPNDC